MVAVLFIDLKTVPITHFTSASNTLLSGNTIWGGGGGGDKMEADLVDEWVGDCFTHDVVAA